MFLSAGGGDAPCLEGATAVRACDANQAETAARGAGAQTPYGGYHGCVAQQYRRAARGRTATSDAQGQHGSSSELCRTVRSIDRISRPDLQLHVVRWPLGCPILYCRDNIGGWQGAAGHHWHRLHLAIIACANGNAAATKQHRAGTRSLEVIECLLQDG